MSEYRAVTYDENDSLYVRSLGYEDNPALAHWGPGYRNYCILHYVVKGSGFFNGERVCEDQGFFISFRQLQEYHSDAEQPWNYFWIIFSEEIARKYVLPALHHDDRQIFSFEHKGKIRRMFEDVFNEDGCMSHTRALGFLFQLISLHEMAAEPCPCISAQYVRNAKSYIECNFNKKIRVEDVAEEVHVNDRYLYNLFMKHEGISPKEYINQQRFHMACGLLANTGLTVSEIACSVGFDDVCAFSRFFSKRAKQSPTQYRKSQ